MPGEGIDGLVVMVVAIEDGEVDISHGTNLRHNRLF
jgi:hypothetical protein